MALRQEEFSRPYDDVDLDRDRVLVERCQAGDTGAFGSLYARYYERLLRFCLRRLHDHHEAEDAAQEAFARAWKALPNFAGERRFYPWLTVIAGNICTDMLRRRSRSTPTEDVELVARPPVGATSAATADERIIAAADSELAHQALDRLSARHRHVLAMREDSGWTYQQIADHEGVEIGTIETLLWRARQALKREFLVLSESKGALAGFLIGAGATIRTVVVRSTHRIAGLQAGASGGSGGGALRNIFAGAAVASAALAAAFVAPHALGSSPQAPLALPASTVTGPAGSRLSLASITPTAASAASAASAGLNGTSIAQTTAPAGGSVSPGSGAGLGAGAGFGTGAAGSLVGDAPLGTGLLSGGPRSTLPVTGLIPALSGAVSGTAAASPAKSLIPDTIGAVNDTVGGLGSAIGSGAATPQLGSSLSSLPAASTTPAGATASTASGTSGSTAAAAAAAIGSGIGGAASALISAIPRLGQG